MYSDSFIQIIGADAKCHVLDLGVIVIGLILECVIFFLSRRTGLAL